MFSRKRKIENEFSFVEKNAEFGSAFAIRLKKGKFKDVIYNYETVQLLEDEETASGELPLKFTYVIIDNQNDKNTDSQKFINLIGDILVHLLEHHFDKVCPKTIEDVYQSE